ncbi:MAG: hypothetical protein HRU19_05780 [Pseudobacteriovorax sp.]|nr:hypothetical protein [Pseudobacteriovorax sp.]
MCDVTPARTCDTEGLAHGAHKDVDVFSASTVPYDKTCDTVKSVSRRTCVDGDIVYSGADLSIFDEGQCTPEEAKRCVAENLDHNASDTVPVFSAETVAFDESCSDVESKVTRTCVNGDIVRSGADEDIFKHAKCKQAEALACEAYNLAHDETADRDVFREQASGLKASCDDLKKTASLTCFNGQIQGEGIEDYPFSKCSAYRSQVWVFQEDKAWTPWQDDYEPLALDSDLVTEDARACLESAQAQLESALADEDMKALIETVLAAQGTERIIALVSDVKRYSSNSWFEGKYIDRDPYFWHWNQDKKVPSLAMSRFDRGAWVWESSLTRGVCKHPSIPEMKRYLEYAAKRLSIANSQ